MSILITIISMLMPVLIELIKWLLSNSKPLTAKEQQRLGAAMAKMREVIGVYDKKYAKPVNTRRR